jgi:hypothetical protein
MGFKPVAIPSDELQDFWAVIAQSGFDPRSFMLTAREEVPLNPGPVRRIVKVERSQYSRDFQEGFGDSWVVKAIDAVKGGYFGKP